MNTETTTVMEKCVFPIVWPKIRVQRTSYMRPVDPGQEKANERQGTIHGTTER